MATLTEPPWPAYALDARALFNPAFGAWLIAHAARGHERDYARPLPLPLSFLVLPLVLHAPTRDSLPSLNARLANWADKNPVLRAELRARAPQLTAVTRQSLRFGVRYAFIEITQGGVSAGDGMPNHVEHSTTDVADCVRGAERLGRWLPRAGTPTTVFSLLGVRP